MRNFYVLCSFVILACWAGVECSQDANKVDASSEREKRSFDRLDSTGFSGFMNKRGMFDRFDTASAFGSSGFGKRGFDRLDAFNGMGAPSFGKRGFDRLDSYSSFGSLGKRGFDRLDLGSPGFSNFQKRRFDSFDTSAFNELRRKRTLDKLDANGVFSSGL